eukprot:CAMPEP_0172604468 /NCGR_PEP_ID=MMETSP1068-20121228/24726_1 /TAXON_ID=35684 /ORGANISM="Pseudopedinella elastica, Strain CCMP716" /LENGTH=55 /DNA_ID=CAMNT_0013406551 /DNA_START=76 /DNA_END=239 /DNA_ORIENTATION=+
MRVARESAETRKRTRLPCERRGPRSGAQGSSDAQRAKTPGEDEQKQRATERRLQA